MSEEGGTARPARRMSTVLIVGAVAVAGLAVAAVIAGTGHDAGDPVAPPPDVRSTIDTFAANLVKYESAGPPPKVANVVLTSEEAALALGGRKDAVGGAADQPVYLVQLSGDFAASDVPVAGGAPPTGGTWDFMVNPHTGGTTDLGLREKPEDLASLGVVTRVALQPPKG